jgi:hypothetical protein
VNGPGGPRVAWRQPLGQAAVEPLSDPAHPGPMRRSKRGLFALRRRGPRVPSTPRRSAGPYPRHRAARICPVPPVGTRPWPLGSAMCSASQRLFAQLLSDTGTTSRRVRAMAEGRGAGLRATILPTAATEAPEPAARIRRAANDGGLAGGFAQGYADWYES